MCFVKYKDSNGLGILHLWLHASSFTGLFLVFTFSFIYPRVLFALPVMLICFLSIFTGSLIHEHYTRECEFGNFDK